MTPSQRSSLEVADRCRRCGRPIPALPLEDAFCVGCRYEKTPRRSAGGRASEFDIACEVVPAPEPIAEAPASDAPVAADALDALCSGLSIVLEGGHRDAIPARAAALAVLCRLYPSQAATAARLGIAPSSLSRALAALRSELSARRKAGEAIQSQRDAGD